MIHNSRIPNHGTSLDWSPTKIANTSRGNSSGRISPRTERIKATATVLSPDTPEGKLCCDKCDGEHQTDDCPHFKKTRDDHPDALNRPKMGITGLGGTQGNVVVKNAKVVKQPGDGSCLFHSLAYGLPPPLIPAQSLRKKLAAWMVANPTHVIAHNPLKDWIKWDTGKSVKEYASRICRPSVWGGGIEMAVTSHLFCVDIHVYEYRRGEYKRISCFEYEGEGRSKGVVSLLYAGGIHFDALIVPQPPPSSKKETTSTSNITSKTPDVEAKMVDDLLDSVAIKLKISKSLNSSKISSRSSSPRLNSSSSPRMGGLETKTRSAKPSLTSTQRLRETHKETHRAQHHLPSTSSPRANRTTMVSSRESSLSKSRLHSVGTSPRKAVDSASSSSSSSGYGKQYSPPRRRVNPSSDSATFSDSSTVLPRMPSRPKFGDNLSLHDSSPSLSSRDSSSSMSISPSLSSKSPQQYMSKHSTTTPFTTTSRSSSSRFREMRL